MTVCGGMGRCVVVLLVLVLVLVLMLLVLLVLLRLVLLGWQTVLGAVAASVLEPPSFWTNGMDRMREEKTG